MKNKSLIIGGIVLSLVIVLSIGTYAYWTLTRSQEGENKLIGGCLSIDITEESAGISLEKAWPISDFEGMQLEGYTFEVTNYCEEAQDYRIDLDRLIDSEGRKEMTNKSLATLLDYGVPVLYSELETGETTESDVQEKRVLAYDTVAGKVGDTPGSNTHTLRIWIDEESDIEDQGSTFLSRVEINSGQGIEKYYTPEECFTFDSANKSITAYDVSCGGTDVVIPYEIDGAAVTQIGTGAFREKGLTSVEFPRSVTTIGQTAFQYNPTLEKIIFRDGLTSLGQGTFTADSSNPINIGALTFVSFPNTLTTIGANAFLHNSLEQVIVPDGVTGSLIGVFKGNMIKEFKLGSGVDWSTSTGLFAFNEIEEVIVPDNVTSLGNNMFNGNPLKKITIGTNVTKIGLSTFSNDTGVTPATYPDKNIYAGENFLTEVYIPANVTSIGNKAFYTATSDVIIRTERTKEDFLANITAATTSSVKWYGNARVIDCNGVPIYE